MQKRKNTKKVSKKSVRLDKSVVPVEYDIQLRPDLENFTFEGLETITIFLQKATKKLTLHSKEIEISTAHAILNKEKVFGKISYHEKAETATFTFPKALPKGKQKLTLVFKGILNDKMRGFYRSSYVYDGQVHHMATSQLESTDARRAFPCFDEPAHKAVFHVSLVVPKGKTAISNTLPVTRATHEAGYEVIRFAPTPKMSTYLLAFIVGDFEYIEKKSDRGVIVRVYTTPGKKHQAEFALDVTVKVLEFYEKYFDIPYPLNTLDMIAVPDFAAGAMENWGAVTYRESMLLVDENHSSSSTRQWVALVIAHELAHQWFGNLVTMEWWTHLWLNEGFASYIEYLAVDKIFPQWQIWNQFVTQDTNTALRLDALSNTHPIEVEVHHPSEIGEIFDAVSYSKGASIIRMLATYLGDDDFRKGLSHYLKKHSYKNAETWHLWEAFEKISKKPVGKIMKNWTSLGGYPVIHVSKSPVDAEELVITQSRFFSSVLSKKRSNDKTVWQVPLTIHSDVWNQKALLTKKKQTFNHKGEWLKVNTNETGFYRTSYSNDLLTLLSSPIRNKSLSASDRLGVVRDLFALAEAGEVSTADVLKSLYMYTEEDSYVVWSEIASGLSKVQNLILNSKTDVNFRLFTIKLFEPIYKKLGWDKKQEDTHEDSLLRALVVSRLGRAGYKEVVSKAKHSFAKIDSKEKINPDLRGAIYSIVAKHGSKKDFMKLKKMYREETLHEEKNRIGYAMCDFTSQVLLQDAVEFAFSKDVRSQDTERFLAMLAMDRNSRDLWLKVIQKKWQIILERYAVGGYTISRIVQSIAGTAEKKHFVAFKKFFLTHEAPGAERAVEQALERMESNILWFTRDGKAIAKFLENAVK